MEPDYWLHDIRGKAGKNILQAFVTLALKLQRRRTEQGKSPLSGQSNEGEASVQGWYDGGGGGLIRSSYDSCRKVEGAKGLACLVSMYTTTCKRGGLITVKQDRNHLPSFGYLYIRDYFIFVIEHEEP